MKDATKELIKNLTQMYIRDSAVPASRAEQVYTKLTEVHKVTKRKKSEATWSADFVQGKGEGLTFLLHGSPGVGKTYTAGRLLHCDAATSG
jgi:signal recognition particle GTPase